MKIVTSEQMRRIEQECVKAGIPTSLLMENAGRAVAEEVGRLLGNPKGWDIMCLIGPGNNGGDGLVAARYLHDAGARVTVCLCAARPVSDPNLELVRQRRITEVEPAGRRELEKFGDILKSADCLIDAIFGTGKVRPFSGALAGVLGCVAVAREKNRNLRIVAVDLPSGLNADTGEVEPAALWADHTISLGFPKPGLFSFPGAERVGKLTIADIGIPADLARGINRELVTPEWAKSVLPRRPLDSNKGSFGRVMVVAGSSNYIGAAYLACSGAMRVGAGLVTLAAATSVQSIVAAKLTEATCLPLPESADEAAKAISSRLSSYDALVIGCGLGQSESTTRIVEALLFHGQLPATVIDGDGLNTFAAIPDWWRRFSKDAILTPHPGEMSRLTRMSIEDVQRDRTATAEKFAGQWGKTVVLKGAYTVIAAPDGRTRLNPAANPGLATAGTGDVLSGVIGGLAAQGIPLFDAAALGVYLHSAAGESVRAALGDTGMIAGDLLPELPLVIKHLRE